MILSFRTDRPEKTRSDCSRSRSTLFRSSLIWVYTVCNSICIFWSHYSMVEPHCSNFRTITAIFRQSKYLGILRNLPLHMVPDGTSVHSYGDHNLTIYHRYPRNMECLQYMASYTLQINLSYQLHYEWLWRSANTNVVKIILPTQ